MINILCTTTTSSFLLVRIWRGAIMYKIKTTFLKRTVVQMHFSNYETHWPLNFWDVLQRKGLESNSSGKRGFPLYVCCCFHAERLLCIQRKIPHQKFKASSSVSNISEPLHGQEGCFIKHLQDSSARFMTCVFVTYFTEGCTEKHAELSRSAA